MYELTPEYKIALQNTRVSFDQKYGMLIDAALVDLSDKYGIDDSTKLADVLRVSMRKFVLGLDQKLGFYKVWFNRHSQTSQFVAENYGEMYPAHSTAYDLNISETYSSPELEGLLALDIWRNRTVLRVHQLIEQHVNDVKKPDFGDTTLAVLGSMIGRGIRIYYRQNGCEHEVGIDFTSRRGISILERYQDNVRSDLRSASIAS